MTAPEVDHPAALGRFLRVATIGVAGAAAAGLAFGGAVAEVVVPVLAIGIVSRLVWLAGRWRREGDGRAALQAGVLAALCTATWVAATVTR